MPRLTNRQLRPFVEQRIPLKNSKGTVFATPYGPENNYTVFSYGTHWPLWVAVEVEGKVRWFGNDTPNSPTTNRHRGYTTPYSGPVTMISREQIGYLVDNGFEAFVRRRVLEGE